MDLSYRYHKHYYTVFDERTLDWCVRERQTPKHSFSSWHRQQDADRDAKSRNAAALFARILNLDIMHQ